jgi:hypothetical protein
VKKTGHGAQLSLPDPRQWRTLTDAPTNTDCNFDSVTDYRLPSCTIYSEFNPQDGSGSSHQANRKISPSYPLQGHLPKSRRSSLYSGRLPAVQKIMIRTCYHLDILPCSTTITRLSERQPYCGRWTTVNLLFSTASFAIAMAILHLVRRNLTVQPDLID